MADKDVLYHEVLEALQAEGCALCRLAYRASDSYLNALLHEGVTDVRLREELRDARGVCHRHATRLTQKRGAVLGTAIVYRDVVNTLIKALEAEPATSSRVFGRRQPQLANDLAAQTECPACLLERDAEQRSARILLKHVNDPTIHAAYVAAGGLCLPHFQIVLSNAGRDVTRLVADWQATAWRTLRAELDELIRKHDYRFGQEIISDEEAVSWTRAVAAVTGRAEPHDNS